MEPFQIRDESLEDVDVDSPWNTYEDTSRLLASNNHEGVYVRLISAVPSMDLRT